MSVEWMRDLDKDIWRIVDDGFYQVATETRILTKDELDRIFSTVKSEDLVCTLFNACMGFGIGLVIHDCHPPSPGMTPDYLLRITNEHLGNGGRFDDGWKLFHPIASTPRNKQLLEYYGIPPIKQKTYYEY